MRVIPYNIIRYQHDKVEVALRFTGALHNFDCSVAVVSSVHVHLLRSTVLKPLLHVVDTGYLKVLYELSLKGSTGNSRYPTASPVTFRAFPPNPSRIYS